MLVLIKTFTKGTSRSVQTSEAFPKADTAILRNPSTRSMTAGSEKEIAKFVNVLGNEVILEETVGQR